MRKGWLFLPGFTLIALLALSGNQAGAQTDLNCDDFKTQPEAQASLNSSYPDDPNKLDGDKDWIACEDAFGLTPEEAARVVPANLANKASQPTPATAAAPTPVADTSAAAPTATPASVDSRVDPPADLIAQVASCEVVAVSSRSIAAAGCPGVGSIVLRPPAGTPRMRSQVIIRPGAAFGTPPERVATAAQRARPEAEADKPARKHKDPSGKKHRKAAQATTGTK